jgi:membrane protein implicated in regulation of membrane protease activity
MELFSVLPKENCLFFYILSVISLLTVGITIIVGLTGTKTKWKIVLLSVISPLVMYYTYRLFYSMCEGSLH